MKPYQLERITGFLNPESEALGIMYQQNNSILSIASGKLYGKRLMEGASESRNYNTVDVRESDFIWTPISEEFGFIGCITILVLLCLLILRLFYISYTANNTFSAVLTLGIAAMFLSQTFENIMMCIGLFPVIGITLPLFSYGGSSVITMYAALGIAAGVRMREKPSWLR